MPRSENLLLKIQLKQHSPCYGKNYSSRWGKIVVLIKLAQYQRPQTMESEVRRPK